MKKIVFMDESDRQGYLNYLESIKQAEADKDEFCKAARIERKPMDDERFRAVLRTILIIAGMGAVLAFTVIFYQGCAMIS